MRCAEALRTRGKLASGWFRASGDRCRPSWLPGGLTAVRRAATAGVCLLLVSYMPLGVDGALLVLCRRSATCQLLSRTAATPANGRQRSRHRRDAVLSKASKSPGMRQPPRRRRGSTPTHRRGSKQRAAMLADAYDCVVFDCDGVLWSSATGVAHRLLRRGDGRNKRSRRRCRTTPLIRTSSGRSLNRTA